MKWDNKGDCATLRGIPYAVSANYAYLPSKMCDTTTKLKEPLLSL